MDWPGYTVEKWPIERLRPYDRNPRAHSVAQLDQIGAAMAEWGWTIPVLADEDGMILAGHGRVLAAKRKGYREAPVIVARGWSEAQKRAYIIADNRLSENSRWDDALLELELGELGGAGFDVALIGMSDADMKRLGGAPLPVVEIATSEVADEFWIAVRGPLKHQADALLALEAAMKDLPGVSVELGTAVLE